MHVRNAIFFYETTFLSRFCIFRDIKISTFLSTTKKEKKKEKHGAFPINRFDEISRGLSLRKDGITFIHRGSV